MTTATLTEAEICAMIADSVALLYSEAHDEECSGHDALLMAGAEFGARRVAEAIRMQFPAQQDFPRDFSDLDSTKRM